MKKTMLALVIIVSTLVLSGCCCGFSTGCCGNSTPYPTSNCCGLNNGW